MSNPSLDRCIVIPSAACGARKSLVRALSAVLFVLLAAAVDGSGEPLRVAVAGLVHGHVEGFLRQAKERA